LGTDVELVSSRRESATPDLDLPAIGDAGCACHTAASSRRIQGLSLSAEAARWSQSCDLPRTHAHRYPGDPRAVAHAMDLGRQAVRRGTDDVLHISGNDSHSEIPIGDVIHRSGSFWWRGWDLKPRTSLSASPLEVVRPVGSRGILCRWPHFGARTRRSNHDASGVLKLVGGFPTARRPDGPTVQAGGFSGEWGVTNGSVSGQFTFWISPWFPNCNGRRMSPRETERANFVPPLSGIGRRAGR
jgi:hypothetical protein